MIDRIFAEHFANEWIKFNPSVPFRRPGAQFVRTTGLGHRRILRDPEVIARVAAFIAEPDYSDRQS